MRPKRPLDPVRRTRHSSLPKIRVFSCKKDDYLAIFAWSVLFIPNDPPRRQAILRHSRRRGKKWEMTETIPQGACPERTSLQKAVIPVKKGIHYAFINYLKRMDFTQPDMTRLRGNDTQVLSRLFAVTSVTSVRRSLTFPSRTSRPALAAAKACAGHIDPRWSAGPALGFSRNDPGFPVRGLWSPRWPRETACP